MRAKPRLVIVGQAPNRRGDPPLLGRTGDRVRALLGISEDRYLAVERLNLLGGWPGPQRGGKGDRFSAADARRGAPALLDGLEASPGTVVVLAVGVATGRALGADASRLFRRQWVRRTVQVVVMPHASGICRWWNDGANVARARRSLRRLARSLGVA